MLICAGIYFFFVIVLCVLSAVTTTFVMQLHIRAESVPVTNMAPWVSCYCTNKRSHNLVKSSVLYLSGICWH